MSGDRQRRLVELRAVIMASAKTRAGAEDVAAAMLLEIADLDDQEPAPEWVVEAAEDPTMTVGDLRGRLRLLLSDLAASS